MYYSSSTNLCQNVGLVNTYMYLWSADEAKVNCTIKAIQSLLLVSQAHKVDQCMWVGGC